MVLRDVALSASGLLDRRLGGQPVYPYQPDQIWEALAITKERDFTYPASHGSDLYRRSLYTFWRRTVNPANMFDMANRQTCNVRASRTCTPLHALTTLNDPTWAEAARVLADKAMTTTSDTDGRLAFVFRRVLGRRPTDYDMTALRGPDAGVTFRHAIMSIPALTLRAFIGIQAPGASRGSIKEARDL